MTLVFPFTAVPSLSNMQREWRVRGRQWQKHRIRARESKGSREGERPPVGGKESKSARSKQRLITTYFMPLNLISDYNSTASSSCNHLHFINAKIPSGLCGLLFFLLTIPIPLSFLLLSVLVLAPLRSIILYSLHPFPLLLSSLCFLPFSQKYINSIIIWINLLCPPAVVRQAHVHKSSSPLHFFN